MNKPSFLHKHTGIVDELKVHKALSYISEHPHPWAVARFEHTKAENELKRTWAEVYGEQKEGGVEARKAATDRDDRVCKARDGIAKTQLDMDAHRQRIEAARSLLDIFQTESANTRHVGKLT